MRWPSAVGRNGASERGGPSQQAARGDGAVDDEPVDANHRPNSSPAYAILTVLGCRPRPVTETNTAYRP